MLFKIVIVLDTSARPMVKAADVTALSFSNRLQKPLVCPCALGHCPNFFSKFAMVSCFFRRQYNGGVRGEGGLLKETIHGFAGLAYRRSKGTMCHRPPTSGLPLQ